MMAKNIEKELKIFVIFTAIVIWGQAIASIVFGVSWINIIISFMATLLIYISYRMIIGIT
jgi:hypothetical protein